MNELSGVDTNINISSRSKRSRGAFPRIPISETFELLEKIYELSGESSIRRLLLFDELKKSPESGSSRTLVSTSNGSYGLIEGSASAEKLSLSKRGLTIVNSDTDRTRKEAIYDALFSNGIFAATVSRFSGKALPVDAVAIDFLKDSHNLKDSDAISCWETIKTNLREQGLTQTLSGKEVVVDRQTAVDSLNKVPETTRGTSEILTDSQQVDIDLPSASKGDTGLLNKAKIAPEIHFNIQIIIPESANPETYDAIFKAISNHLLNSR